jgi:MoaA/NifB/PqqE/SkfB family radical SAM enzyme
MALVQLSLRDKVLGLGKYFHSRLDGRPSGVTLELTRRCNAKCDYCNHWREPRRKELDADGFIDVVKRFDPLAVTVCGGEPMIRRDCLEITRRIKALPGWRYLLMITNGWFLDEERARALLDTGIDQINLSLNYPDARQDDDRKLHGLFARIAHIVPWLTARGAKVELNTVLMRDNLDCALDIVALAESWGAGVLFTLYSELPAGNKQHLFPPELRPRVRALCAELLRIRATRGIVANEEWYLEHVPRYVEGERIGGCAAGKRTIHITPDGMVRVCAELPPIRYYKEFSTREQPWTSCTACFQACRGEVQAPVTARRIARCLRG